MDPSRDSSGAISSLGIFSSSEFSLKKEGVRALFLLILGFGAAKSMGGDNFSAGTFGALVMAVGLMIRALKGMDDDNSPSNSSPRPI